MFRYPGTRWWNILSRKPSERVDSYLLTLCNDLTSSSVLNTPLLIRVTGQRGQNRHRRTPDAVWAHVGIDICNRCLWIDNCEISSSISIETGLTSISLLFQMERFKTYSDQLMHSPLNDVPPPETPRAIQWIELPPFPAGSPGPSFVQTW